MVAGANIHFFSHRKRERMDTSEARHIQDFRPLEKSGCHAEREQLVLLVADLNVRPASKSFYAAFQVAPGQAVGRKLVDLTNRQWNIPALLMHLNELPKLDGEFVNFEIELVFPATGRKRMLVTARQLSGDDAQGGMILLSIRVDIGQKRVEAEIGELLTLFRAILASIGDAVIVTDPESHITFMNPAAEKLTGWTQNDALQRNLTDILKIVNERSSGTVENPVTGAIRDGAVVGLANHTVLIARDGSEWPIDDGAGPSLDAGRLVGVVLLFHDVANRRKWENEIEASEVGYRRTNDLTRDANATSASKRISHSGPKAVKYHGQAGTSEERERLILEHLPQVRLIARRLHERLPESVNLDDLISSGTIGLIAAIDHFDASHNVKLKTYAEYKIRGAILDSLRGLDWAPRQQRKRTKQIAAAIAAVEQYVHRTPAEEEIAKELRISVEEYHEWLVAVRGVNMGSLDTVSPEGDGTSLLRYIPGDEETWPSRIVEKSELQRLLAAAIEKIPRTERKVISLYYHQELTLREIAKIVNLHESRISQLKSQAILRLRSYLQKRWPIERGA
jgi:RNA polymerase sigma factor FliA